MRIYVHLGVHKTATTLIQNFLHKNEKKLKKHRISSMLLRECMTMVGPWAKGLAKRDAAEFQNHIKGIADSGTQSLVISCEDLIGSPFPGGRKAGLYPNASENMQGFYDLLGDRYTIHPIIYLRPQAEFIQSWYLQLVNKGSDETFPRWFERQKNANFSWEPLVSGLDRISNGMLKVRDFRSISNGSTKYAEDFCHFFNGPANLEMPKTKIQNPGLGDKGLELALKINKMLTQAERMKVRRFLQKNFSNKDYPRPVLFTPEEIENVNGRYREEYERILSRFR